MSFILPLACYVQPQMQTLVRVRVRVRVGVRVRNPYPNPSPNPNPYPNPYPNPNPNPNPNQLAALPDERDPSTDLGCYLQVTTTYGKGKAFIDYNCAYSSEWYRARQRKLNAQVEALCPAGIERYVNTPSAFLSPRDYYSNYDELAATKALTLTLTLTLSLTLSPAPTLTRI